MGRRRNRQKACDIGDIGRRACAAYQQELHTTHPLAMTRTFGRSLVCEISRGHGKLPTQSLRGKVKNHVTAKSILTESESRGLSLH